MLHGNGSKITGKGGHRGRINEIRLSMGSLKLGARYNGVYFTILHIYMCM